MCDTPYVSPMQHLGIQLVLSPQHLCTDCGQAPHTLNYIKGVVEPSHAKTAMNMPIQLSQADWVRLPGRGGVVGQKVYTPVRTALRNP